MPCYDDRDSASNVSAELRNEIYQLKDTIDTRNAMLCAIFNAAKKLSASGVASMLDNLDYEECGLTRAYFEKWWAEHQAEDAARLKAIQEKKEAAERKAEAMQKKTAAVRKLKSVLSANLTAEELSLVKNVKF